MKVYVAGPYTVGDVAKNVRAAIAAADELVARGHCPYVPHLTHFWHLLSPKPYDFWLAYDETWLFECDAVLRLPGLSSGADGEVDVAKLNGIPVVYAVEEVDRLAAAR